MSTKNKKDKRKASINTLKNVGKILGLMILTYLVFFIISVIYFRFELNTHGFDSSHDAIEYYIESMTENKPNKIKKCLNHRDNNYFKLIEEHRDYIRYINMVDTELDIDNIEFKEDINYEKINEIQKRLNDQSIESANKTTILIPYKETINNNDFIGDIVYNVVTYSVDNSWFIDDFEQVRTTIFLDENNDTENLTVIGDEKLGYMTVNKNMIPVYSTTENMQTVMYETSDKNAILSMNIIDSNNKSVNDYINTFVSNLEKANIKYSIGKDKINDIDMDVIRYEINDDGMAILQSTWIFTTPLKDGHIHSITLDCNKAGEYATAYIKTYIR